MEFICDEGQESEPYDEFQGDSKEGI